MVKYNKTSDKILPEKTLSYISDYETNKKYFKNSLFFRVTKPCFPTCINIIDN